MSTSSSSTLRTLICWPEPDARHLANALRDQSIDIELKQVANVEELPLSQACDVLHIPPREWRRLPQATREALGDHIGLIVFGPQPALIGDTLQVHSGFSLSEDLPLDEAIGLLVWLHQRLAQNDRLADIAAGSQGRLLVFGNHDRRIATTSSNLPARPHPDVGVLIKNMTVKGDHVDEKNVFHSLGNQENRITMSGHAVIEQIAGKDQINANSVRNDVADIRQIAGEDQSNINRMEDATGQVQQGAHGTQSNRNIVSSFTSRKDCPKCGHGSEATAKFCSQCATPFLDDGPPTVDGRQ